MLHESALAHFISLKSAAAKQGFDLAIASSYRNFDRQCIIWNEKAKGIRAIMNDDNEKINIENLSDWEIVQAILRWSALPGASRHHWGTDLDVYDKAAISADYQLQLTHCETDKDGVFGPMHLWLDDVILRKEAFGFYRPYEKDCGGIGCEPWHLSYRPLSDEFAQLLTQDLIASVIEESDIALKQTVLSHLDEIYRRYICL